MNKELLAFLEAQLNSGVDNDTAIRAAINKGYDYVDVSSAIASLGQKKKAPTGPSSSSELYRQATSEFESKQGKSASSSASTSVPEYAQRGLGYSTSGEDVSNLSVPSERRAEVTARQEAFIGQSDEQFAKQVQDTYKYLGYSPEKASELAGSLYSEATAQGVVPQDLWRNTYHVGYKREDLEELQGVVPIESREKYQDIVSLGDAAWGNMFESARNMGATTKDIYENVGLRPLKNILSEDVTYDDSLFVFDTDDDTDPTQGLKRFWNSAVLRTKISNAMSRDDMDVTSIAHYQSELQKNSDDKDYLKSLGIGGVLLEDYVLDAVVAPVLESVLSLGMIAVTSPLASIEDLAQGGRDIQDIANVGAALATPLSALKGAVGIAGLAARGGFTAQQSYALSASSKVLEVMNELGVNTSSAVELDKAFQDKEIMDAARKRAQDYGLPVAIIDGITAGIAGKLATSLVKRGYTKVAAEAVETVGEGVLGATGEALGQISEKGKVYSWGDVALEAIGELAIGLPGRAIETMKRNAKGDNERAYIDYVARAAASNEDASVVTNTAYMMNYGEAIAIDNKIREIRDALKAKGISRETRASLRGELSTLTESKFEILNKNIEQVRNLAPESRAQAQQLTSEILSIKSDLKLTERKSPAQKGLIAQLTNKVQQLQSVLGGQQVQQVVPSQEFVAPTPAPAATFEVKVPEATTPIIEAPATPSVIGEAIGTRVTYETPSGQTVEGFLFDEGAGKLVVEDDNGALYELGNIEDIGEAQLQDYKLGAIQENVQKGEDGTSYIINGKRYEYRTDNPASLINRDSQGNAVSVTLFDAESGKARTFRGALGNTLAYDITRPAAQPQVQAAPIAPAVEPSPIAEPTPSVEPAPIAEPAVEVPVAEPAVEAAQPAQDFSAQRVSAQAGRVRSGRGVSARVASSVNKLASAFKNALDAPITVVFHDSLESIEDATGGPNEAYYDGENTIHLLKNASDQAIKEEFAHAGLRKAIAGNQEFRESMLSSLEQLAEQTKNPILKQFIKDRLDGYLAQQRLYGFTEGQAMAVAQEEAIIGVLADFTSNLNQLDASTLGKVRRLINELLYRFGIREFSINNNETFIGLAEKFALAARTGRTLNVSVKSRGYEPIPESKVTPEMKKGRARVIDYLGVRGIVPTNIKNLGAGAFGNAYLVESAAGKTVLKQTYSLNESLIGKYYVDKFGGSLPGIADFNDVTAFYVAPKTTKKDWFDEQSKQETLVYIDKQFVQTSFNTKRKGEVSGVSFYTQFETLIGGGDRFALDFSISRGFRIEENGVVKYVRPFNPAAPSAIAKSINRINALMNSLASQDNIKSVDKLVEKLSKEGYSDLFAVAEELNAVSYDKATENFSIDVDFVLEFLEGINDILSSTQESLGFVGAIDIHPGNIGFSNEGKYGISPILFDLDSDTRAVPPDAWEAYRNGDVVNYEPSSSILRTITKVGRQKTREYLEKITENLDYFGTMDILEANSKSPMGLDVSPGDWSSYALRVGSDNGISKIVYNEIREIATRKFKEQQGRSRLTPEAVAALKERVVPGRRIGQGVITSKVADQTPGVDGTLTLSMEMARQYPSVYIKNAWFLTQHPMMRGMADDSLVEKKGKKAGMDAVVSEENMLKADAIYNNFIEVAKGNLLFLHDQFDDTVREYAKRWYDGANVIAQDIASKYNITLEQASGIIAALSPQKDWFMNIDLAYRVVDIIQKSGDTPFDGDMYEHSLSVKRGDKKAYDKLSKEAKAKKDKAVATHKSIIDGMKDKTFAQLDNDLERAIFIRHYDEKFNPRHYNEYNPVGEVVGRAKTAKGVDAKVAWSSYGIIASAVSAARNSSAQAISDALGTQHKIRNFYNNIANPDATFGDVTMDTHAVGAAELLIVSGNSVEVAHNLGSSASNVNGIAGMYYAFAEAYKQAAAERNILPREMQSITWEAIRLLYKDTFKNAKNRVINESIWNKYNNNEITIDETRQQLLDLGGGIDRPGWYKFVGEAGSGQVEPGVQPGERTDAAVPTRRRARKAKPGDDFPAPGRPAGRSRKLRGSAKRFVSLVSEESLIDEILSNPDNYYTPQVLDQVRAQLQLMTKAELVEEMSDGALSGIADAGFSGLKDGDIRIMAAIEMLNRLYDSGDTPGYIKQLDRLFQYGTGIAQALRQFAELKSSTPAGLENMIMKMYERQNIELTEEARQTLAELAAELFDAQRQYRDVSDVVINEGTLDANIDEDAIKAAEDRLFEATRAMDKFNAVFAQNWGDILSQIMQGNLLTMKSQVINLYANVINVGKYATRLLVAAPFDRVISKAKGEEVTVRPSFGAFAHAVSRGAKGFYEAGQIARYGVQPGNAEYRMSLGLKPIQSLMIAFASKDKQSIAFETKRDEWNYRMKMLVRGTFGAPAEVMFRLLPLGDRPIYQFIEGFELYQYGRSLGLEGDALRDFLKFPNLEAREIAQKRALEVTFQDDSKLARGAQAFVRQLETGFGSTNNAMLKVFVRANLPFVKTPANILNQTIRLSNPVFPVYRIISLVAKKGSSKEISEAIGELFISSVIFMTAKKLWENGLISASADQSDSRERGLSYSVFPAASINITGLDRWLSGGDPTFQEGDEFYNYQKMGLGGAIMGAQVAGLKMIDKTNRKQEEILALGETAPDQDSKDPMDVVAEFASTSLGTLSNIFDQSFLTGVDGLLEVLRNPEPATFTSYVEGIFRAAASIPLPNQLSVAFRAEREYLPDYRSNNITEKLVNVVNDRMFGVLGDVPIRVNEWGEDIKQTPEGANPLYYNWFDPTNGRIGTTDPVKVEIYNLFMQTEDPGVIPGVPVEIQSRKLTVPGSDVRVEINADEANKLMKMLGTQRMDVLKGMIESEDWKSYDTETKVVLIKNIYNKMGNGNISIDGERFNFDWYNYKLDIIQNRLFSEQ